MGVAPCSCQRRSPLVLALRYVDVKARVGGLRDLAAGADHRGRSAVGAMRRGLDR